MPYHPPDHDDFFRHLGPAKTRKAVVNGYLDGDSLEKARIWLDSVVPNRSLIIARFEMWIAAGALVVLVIATIVQVVK